MIPARDLVAYFNLDDGSGRFRGIHAEVHVVVVPGVGLEPTAYRLQGGCSTS